MNTKCPRWVEHSLIAVAYQMHRLLKNSSPHRANGVNSTSVFEGEDVCRCVFSLDADYLITTATCFALKFTGC